MLLLFHFVTHSTFTFKDEYLSITPRKSHDNSMFTDEYPIKTPTPADGNIVLMNDLQL